MTPVLDKLIPGPEFNANRGDTVEIGLEAHGEPPYPCEVTVEGNNRKGEKVAVTVKGTVNDPITYTAAITKDLVGGATLTPVEGKPGYFTLALPA